MAPVFRLWERGRQSMVLSRKGRKALRIAAVSAAVYLGFSWLLPLTAPFLLAFLTALALRPSSVWISGKLRMEWKGRRFQLPLWAAGMFQLLLLSAAAGALLYQGGRRAAKELALLAERAPLYVKRLDTCLTGACLQAEEFLSLRKHTVTALTRDAIRGLGDTVKQRAGAWVVEWTPEAARWLAQAFVLTVLFAMGVMLFLQEMDAWTEKMRHSLFQQEFARLGRLLAGAGTAYLRTQGLIMAMTMAICTAAFFLMGSSYALLAGIGIGLLDALPVFGTGTVLIPWALLSAVQGHPGKAAVLAALYLVCYFLREILEARMMGGAAGLSPLETLMAMYAGLRLFGLAGLFLGPAGLLIIREFALKTS